MQQPTMETQLKLDDTAGRLAAILKEAKRRVVFAESCTAGLVAATLSRIPGISSHLCGSAVTYREDTKARWIEVDGGLLAEHGAVCEQVARQMADGVLKATPEADLAISITGHLGPGAPSNLDGVVFIGHAVRDGKTGVAKHRLIPDVESDRVRAERQFLAAELVLSAAIPLA